MTHLLEQNDSETVCLVEPRARTDEKLIHGVWMAVLKRCFVESSALEKESSHQLVRRSAIPVAVYMLPGQIAWCTCRKEWHFSEVDLLHSKRLSF